MRAALLQMTSGIDAGANARVLCDAVARAAGEGAGMLFTPEGTVYIDPYTHDPARHAETYVVYRAADLQADPALRGRTADEVIGG